MENMEMLGERVGRGRHGLFAVVTGYGSTGGTARIKRTANPGVVIIAT